MGRKYTNWDEINLQEEALKYNSIRQFQLANSGAYQAARRRGIDKFCSHMVVAKGGFNPTKPAYFYYMKFYKQNYNPIYKIGVTNRTPTERLKGMRVKKGWDSIILQELYFEKGADAIIFEKHNTKIFKKYQYKGDKIMQNGITELFVTDILGLDSLSSNKI